jgi:hypothetical protein
MVVARSEIRAVSTVVKQFPVEMPQEGSSASRRTRMRRRIVMEEHYTDANNPRLLFWMGLRNFRNVSVLLLWRTVAVYYTT